MKHAKSQSYFSNPFFNKEKEKILPNNKYPFSVVDKNRFTDQIHSKIQLHGYQKQYRQKHETSITEKESIRSAY